MVEEGVGGREGAVWAKTYGRRSDVNEATAAAPVAYDTVTQEKERPEARAICQVTNLVAATTTG